MNQVFLKKKETYGDGPWLTEPDDFKFSYMGYTCAGERFSNIGIWLGYVFLPQNHPLAIAVKENLTIMNPALDFIQVHGGITDIRWEKHEEIMLRIGFDCGHVKDLIPLASVRMKKENPYLYNSITYRDMPFVMNQCMRIVDQIIQKYEFDEI